MDIGQLIEEHGYSIASLAQSIGISQSTLRDTVSKHESVDEWKVGVFRAVSDELEMGMDEMYQELLLQSESLTPFIKWVGGKRQLLGEIEKLMPEKYDTYYEPFVGGGAVLLHNLPKKAVINDLNSELINTWNVVKNDSEKLIKLLEEYKGKNSKDFYLNLRIADRDGRMPLMSSVEKAARFIFMNKTGFNGLYRVNSKGQNNVPYGRYKNPNIADMRILSVSNYLQNNDISILNGSYINALSGVSTGDFVYFDPPYIPSSQTAAFTSYTSEGFNIDDQKKLRDIFFMLKKQGVQVMLSNSDTELTKELYKDANIHFVKATRMINSKAAKRGKVGEVIITSY